MPFDSNYAKYIDHTVLKIGTTKETLKKFCDEAKEYHFASVCINPCNVEYVAEQLKGSGVKTCSVIGFPLGANTSAMKAAEAAEAIKNGADEVDMVINVGRLKDKDYDYVLNDNIQVITGMNFTMLLELLGQRMSVEKLCDLSIEDLIETGKNGIVSLNAMMNAAKQ